MKFGIFLPISFFDIFLSLQISMNIPVAEQVDLWHIHELYQKWYLLICKLHTFPPEPNDANFCRLLSRVITEPYFNYILGMEIKSYGGTYTIPSSNHLCSTHYRLKSCIFIKSSTLPWVFFTYKWYQIAQNVTSEFAIITWKLKNS